MKTSPQEKSVFDFVVPRIVAVTPPLLEIWFHGSRARKDHKRKSDWDFLAVLPADEMRGPLAFQLALLEGPSGKMRDLIDGKVLDVQRAFEGCDDDPVHPLFWAKREGRLIWSRGVKTY